MRRDPWALGYARSRWTLALLRQHLRWLRLDTDAGLHKLLRRLAIVYKRGRHYVHSPDADYLAKCAYIDACRAAVDADPERFVLLYLDECSYTQQPTLEKAYEARGHAQARADWGVRSRQQARLAGVLDPRTGRVLYLQQASVGRRALVDFYGTIRAAYAQVETIYVVQDNAPVHFHPDVLCALEPQQWPWPFVQNPKWAKLAPRAREADPLPIQVLCLPTYASWLNPIEKLWRWLRQEVLHLHRMSMAWPELKQRVAAFLDQFSGGSTELLRYVGLLPD